MPTSPRRPANPQARTLQLMQYVPYQIGLLASRVRSRLLERALDQQGVSIAEWRLLVLVGEANLCSARDIVQHSDMDHVVVHRAVVRLEARGLLYRIEDPGNRRLKLLRLSSNGTQLLEQIIPVAYAIQEELLAVLAPDDEAALRRILGQLVKSFGADAVTTMDGQVPEHLAPAAPRTQRVRVRSAAAANK